MIKLYLDILFIIIVSLYLYWIWGLLRALKSDAPYVPITQRPLDRLIEFAEPQPGELWIDLGSGDGRVLIQAAKKYKIQGLGIERVAAFRHLSRLKILIAGLRSRIKIKRGDLFSVDLSQAAIVSFYLLPATNKRLFEKFRAELKPGTKLVWHRFRIADVPIEKEDAELKVYMTRL